MSGYPRQPLNDVQCGRILMDAKPTLIRSLAALPEVRCKRTENVGTALNRAIELLMCSDVSVPYKSAGENTRYGGRARSVKCKM